MSYANDMPTVESASRTDAGLAAELRTSVMRLRRRLASERDPANELSIGSMAVLGLLHRRGECTVGQLADFEKVRPPSMTRTVNCLVDGGYATRRSDEADKRQVLVQLTDKGRETLLADRRRRDAWLNHRLRELSAHERSVLREAAPILERLASA